MQEVWLFHGASRNLGTPTRPRLDEALARNPPHPVYRCSVHGTVPNELGRYSQISDPTLADAILDRLIHNAYRLELQGVSMRKTHSRLPATVD